MGTSTNAYLFFGFDVHDPEQGESEIQPKSPMMWCKQFDCETCNEMKPCDCRDDCHCIDCEEDWVDYWNKKIKHLGVTIGIHCSSEAPIYYITAQEFIANRGYPTEVRVDANVATLEHSLKQACEILGIKWVKPSWKLASYWG